MTEREALKLALEALEEAWYHVGTFQPTEKAIDLYDEARTAIKEALAQPEHGWTPERIKGMARLKEAQDKKLAQPDQEQLMSDQINYGMSVTQGGKRIDPMSIYKEPEQEPVAHSVVAGALFDFMGWLTSRNKRLTLSGADEASPAVEAIQEFSEKRGLSLKDAEVGFWTEFLFTPPQRKPLTDEEIILIVADCASSHQHTDIHFARAIERAHGIKELV